MYLLTLTGRLEYLVLICISSALLILSIGFRKSRLAAESFSFLAPVLMLTISAFAWGSTQADELFILSGPVLSSLILLNIFMARNKNKSAGIIVTVGASVAVNAIVFIFKGFISTYSNEVLVAVPVIVSICNTMILIKGRKENSIPYIALYILCISSAVLVFDAKPMAVTVSLMLMTASLLIFLIYYFRALTENMHERLEKAEYDLYRMKRSMEMEVRKRTFEIERVNERLLHISKTDNLTQALTKAAIIAEMDRQITYKKDFSILMFDIDDFKEINDKLGHSTGDMCLKKLALAAKSSIRPIDMLGRYGGDEFIILLPSLDSSQAMYVAERFRKKVEESENPHYTVSIGIASFPEDGSSVKELVDFADQGLYKSKSLGKNMASRGNS